PIPGVLFPASDVGLSPEEVTVAEVLKAEGYATAIVGKWHLGDQPEFLPNRQGFDLHFGLPYSNDMGPAEDGVKSSLGQPLPKPKGPGQPPLPLLRNGTVVKRVLPDDQPSLVELYTAESPEFHEASTFEGGVRVPTIAWWPGKIPAGTETGAILGMFDVLPTFAALAGGKLPAGRKLDGADVWPHLAGVPGAGPAHETFYYYRGL